MKALREIRLFRVQATARTVWLFLRVRRGDLTGWGEATLEGQEAAVAAVARRLGPDLVRGAPGTSDRLLAALPFATLPEAAFSSALMQALADIGAQTADQPLWAHLGGAAAAPVPVYANINRRTRERSPAGMRASATLAVARGHLAIKIAPFDEVAPTLSRREMRQAMAPGLARIAALREGLGAGTALMVDCHWRFDVAGAQEMIAAVAPFALYWVECPVAEHPQAIPDLVALRARAHRFGTRLAGLETQIRADGFAPYLRAGAYDVMMPDVKYAGGPFEVMRIARMLTRAGVGFSPHNPSGPICHAQAVHLCAAHPGAGRLEMQFDESPLFDRICVSPVPPPAAGEIDPAALGPGAGVDLRTDALTPETEIAHGTP